MRTFGRLFTRGILPLFVAVTIAYAERSATSHFLPFMLREGAIAQAEASAVLAAFGLGYVVGLPFSGLLIRQFGHRRLLTLLSIGWLIASLMFPRCETYTALAATRFALGMFEAPLFPLFVSWITLSTTTSRRIKLIAIVEGSSYVGMAIAGPITVFVAESFGWRFGYTLVGTMALLTLAASLTMENPPREEEVATTRASLTRQHLFLVCAIGLGFFLYNMAKSFYSTWFPTFLLQQWGFSSTDAASLTFAQNIAAPLGSLALAAFSASLLTKGWSVAASRLLPFAAGCFFGALAWIPLVFPQAMSAFAILSFVGLIATSALIWNSLGDLFPASQVARTAGYVNALANLGSFASPLLVGSLIAHAPSSVLVVISGFALGAFAFFFIAYGGGKSLLPTSFNDVAAR